jgi:hypothetical protein
MRGAPGNVCDDEVARVLVLVIALPTGVESCGAVLPVAPNGTSLPARALAPAWR